MLKTNVVGTGKRKERKKYVMVNDGKGIKTGTRKIFHVPWFVEWKIYRGYKQNCVCKNVLGRVRNILTSKGIKAT